LSCLAKDPAERPQSARSLAEELERCDDAHSWSEADAERWWTSGRMPAAVSAETPPVSGEQPRLTVSVDLQQRLQIKGGSGRSE
jgi:hypothetical protein